MKPSARSLLQSRAHRQWPLPRRPWALRQSWRDVLFAHWPVDPRVLRARLPHGLELDLTDDLAWIGVTAFEASDTRFGPCRRHPEPRGSPKSTCAPTSGADRPGVYFFSLDAGSAAVVKAARWGFRLPYVFASMTLRRDPAGVHFSTERESDHLRARFEVDYAPSGPIFTASPGTLDVFLIERYCLFASDHRRRLHELEIHHPPWSLQPARADVHVDTLVEATGITAPVRVGPLLHYAARQDVLAWWPTTV